MSTILELAERIELSPVGVAIAESRYAFGIIEGIHVIALALAVGLLFIIDLRLLGAILKDVPVRRVLSQLRPWVIAGFIAVFVTGGLLFWSSALRVSQSPAFAFKLGFIVLAGLNALWFERAAAGRGLDATTLVPPATARFAGAASLVLWSLVVVAGRLIPYLPSWSGAPTGA